MYLPTFVSYLSVVDVEHKRDERQYCLFAVRRFLASVVHV